MDSIGTYTVLIARYIADTEYSELPREAIKRAKLSIVDAVGLGVGASSVPLGEQMVEFAKKQGGKEESTILGEGSKVSCPVATWVNSTLVNLFDYDDTYLGVLHPGNAVIPSALAVGEMLGASGKEIILAEVLGYEVSNRIANAIYPSLERAQHLWVGISAQVFGAMVTASKLLGLDIQRIVNAFGLAGQCAPLPSSLAKRRERPLGFSKNAMGWAAMGGVFWTLLAKEHVPGVHQILDGNGFWLAAGSDRCDFGILTDKLGEKFTILDTSFKPYPACRYIHAVADAISQLIKEHDVYPDEIERITVKGIGQLLDFRDSAPQGMIDAEFSLPHVVAMIVLGRKLGPEWLSQEVLDNDDVQHIRQKVEIQSDPLANELMDKEKGKIFLSTVEVITKRGTFLGQTRYPRGSPENPFSVKEIEQKFIDLVKPVLKDKTGRLLKALQSLEEIENIGSLAELLGSQVEK